MSKIYLGDGVYATNDGFHVVIATENYGQPNPTNTIYLEDKVFECLVEYGLTVFPYLKSSVAKAASNPQD